MSYQHKGLASGSWNELKLVEQMANIGSEVERTINWRNKNNPEYSRLAFERALELLDLTIADPKNMRRLREIVRIREVWADYCVGDNLYGYTDESWNKYFNAFGYAARVNI